MHFFKALSHEIKVILSVVGSGLVVLCSSPEMLATLITQPWAAAVPIILPKLISAGAVGGALYNMKPKDDAPKE